MSLEEELREQLRKPFEELKKRYPDATSPETGVPVDALQMIFDVVMPMVGAQQDAIIRLARELDEHRAKHPG